MRLIDPLPGRYDASDPFGTLRPQTGLRHLGSDWIVPSGTPVPAIGSGTVTSRGSTSYNGAFVTVRLPDGHHYAYIHLLDVLVGVGDTVTIGQIIARSGQSGSNANIPGLGGPHLHITVSGSAAAADGVGPLIDPWQFIQDHIDGTDPVPPAENEEDMSYSIVPSTDGTIYLCSLVTNKKVGIGSPAHVSLLQRYKKNNSNDTMLPIEIDTVQNYIAAIKP
ncbi:M23 family metallopeptidase [Leifsonia sp. ZF2019]|uniref:M23 family metallopeptidase n=1 Tax=Leifsonia sp. ZF2019 TaxID=2781978 RepID=UPI001CBC742F|nr:M23 family metallopeptidase [Leifsonia sp. ZF2019]UAJ80720.1 M23 family metallopeptidase [Leifsonia sp. ZF2019]